MELSSARRLAARCVPGSWSRLWWVAAAISLLPVGSAAAQTAAAPRAKVDAANAAWRKLSQSEVNCVDKALRARNSQIWMLIERGVGPGDASVAGVRTTCRTQAQASSQASSQAQDSSTTARSAAPARATQVLAGQAAAAQAPGREYWSFNGSTLNMVTEGSLRKFFYFQPDPDAEAGGAQRGDLFLEGRVSDQRFVGTVYGFEGRCGRIPYRVDGTIRDNNRRVELQGQKPRIDGNCTVAGTVLDALTFSSIERATAVAAAPSAAKPDLPKPDATRPAAAKPAAKPAIEKAAAVMAAADRAAIEKAETEDAAEFKITADRAPADRRAAGEATPVKVVTAAVSESKLAVNQAVAEKASAGTAVEIARADAARARADAERARNEAEKAVAEAIATVASAQSKISFLYGLISGPAVLGVGAMVFLLVRRRRQALSELSAT